MNNLDKNRKKNKLIFFLSTCKNENKSYDYIYDEKGNKVSGIQTSDAPTKYFLNKLRENGQNIDEILCITSKDAYGKISRVPGDNKTLEDIKLKGAFNKKNENGKVTYYESAYNDYKNMLEEFCEKEHIDNIKLKRLNFDYYLNDEINYEKSEINKIPFEHRHKKLCESIANEVQAGDTIYIDYTSGMRDTSLLIILIIKYLEYKGVEFGGMIYSAHLENPKRIVDLESTYDLFDLLKGVNEFTSFGKSKTLSNYYESIKNIENIEHKDKIKNLINAMDRFSNMMNICILDDLDDVIKDLNKSISDIKNIQSESNNNLMNYMLFNLIDEIEKKFYLDKKGEKITYIKLIKWCLDNELIQQALTLYVEKMPSLYEKFIDFNQRSLSNTIKRNKYIDPNNLAEVFYSSLFSNITFEYYKRNNGFPDKGYEGKDYTYYRNIKVIEALKNKKINVRWLKNGLTLSELELILREYFIFKIFRNQINHAKKSKLIVEIGEILDQYKNSDGSKMYDVKNMNVDNIKNMMMNSIERIEPIVNR